MRLAQSYPSRFLLPCAALLLALSGCNTLRGIGQDLQDGGNALEGSAKRNGAKSNNYQAPASSSNGYRTSAPTSSVSVHDSYETESSH